MMEILAEALAAVAVLLLAALIGWSYRKLVKTRSLMIMTITSILALLVAISSWFWPDIRAMLTTNPTSTPTWEPALYPAPELLGVDIVGDDAVFHWSWTGRLADKQYFALRVGIGNPGYSRIWTKETQYTYTLPEAGEYAWEIAICRGDPAAHVCEQLAVSETGHFQFEGFVPKATPVQD